MPEPGRPVPPAEESVTESDDAFRSHTALLSDTPPHSAMALAVKRAIDLVFAIPLCVLLAPVFALLGIAIKLDSPGPVLFRQPRRGRGFEQFGFVKFRSLTHDARDPHERYEMQEQDPRITRIGSFIRRTSLDELPQLFSVVSGTMSLVGPRPLVEWESRESLRTHPERYLVKPGITGLSQITVRNSVAFHARLAQDVEYVRRWTPALDLWILLRTPWYVVRREAIYPDNPNQTSSHDDPAD